MKCYKCEQLGHIVRDCPNPPNKNYRPRNDVKTESGNATAAAANTMTHWALSMTTLPRSAKTWMWNEDYGIRCDHAQNDDENVTHDSDTTKGELHKTAAHTPNRWILDSGATHHITPDGSRLQNITAVPGGMTFAIASGGHLGCSFKGDLPVRLESGQEAVLKNVHIVPGSDVNLLSARVLARNGWSVTLQDHTATIGKGKERILLRDERGLWTTSFDSAEGSALLVQDPTPTRISLRDEHERLGHIGRHKLLKLAYQGELRINHAAAVLDPFRITSCITCQKMKIARKSMNGISPHGTRNAELVHVDVAGPMEPSSAGYDHFVTMLDDHSKVCAVVPMKGRKPGMGLLKEFVTRIETQLGSKVRFIRSDNGTEFVSHAANEWYTAKGIIHQLSPRYTPELNGTIERFIRTVKEMIGSMLDDSGMGHAMWDYAAQYVAVILMKTTTGKDGKSTWLQYTGREPSVDSIRKFGAPCFVHIPRQARLKARLDEPKAVPGRMIGQSDNISGWIVKIDSNGDIHRSRDVRFIGDENGKRPTAVQSKDTQKFPSVDPGELGPPSDVSRLRLVSDTGSASGPYGHSDRTTTFEGPEVDVTGPPEASFDADGDSTDSGVNRHSRGDGVAPRSPARPEVSDLPPASQPEQLADQPPARTRIRPSSSIELVPERTIEGQENPLPSYTGADGRRVMTRRAPGRTFLSVDHSEADGEETESDAESDQEDEIRKDEETASQMLNIGWIWSTMVDNDEPRSVKEALSGPNRERWQAAIDKELSNLMSKGTWSDVKKPVDRKTIGSRWILRVKRDALGEVVKFKARLVAQGFSQVPGVDFEETYAPVGRTTSLRIMLTISAFMNLEIQQADVEGAYLNGSLDVDIYMRYPDCVVPAEGCDALKLNKALYGLKQAGRLWWKELGNKLGDMGFSKLHSDWGLYIREKQSGRPFMILLVYVDDFVIAAKNESDITSFLSDVQQHWKLSDMGEIGSILGMRVIRDGPARKIYLTQPAYIEKVAKQFPTASNPKFRCSTPLPDGYAAAQDDVPTDKTAFQGLVGCFQWLASCTRPDLSYTASFLARHLNDPNDHHFQLALRTVAYLKLTQNFALTVGGGDDLILRGFVDADWAGCLDTRRSTTGYVFQLNGTAVVWSSKRQQTVACSTVEAEYIAVSEAAREGVWLRYLLREVGTMQSAPTVVHCDNKGAIRLALNPGTHHRTKHIDIKHHFIRELIDDDVISLEYIQSKRQLADILTKGLPKPRHIENTAELGLKEL